MRAAGSTCVADVNEQGCVVASDGQVVGDDLDAFQYPFDESLALGVVVVVGEFDADQQLGRGEGRDGDVVIVVQ